MTNKPLIGAAVIGQSGGPSAVINASAYGVIKTALESEYITTVYGANHGIKGVLDDSLMIMDKEDPKELEAAAADLNYVNLGGDVACMVNGAGLAMATVDIIKYFGGEPANFLDVGGDSNPEKIAKAFNIMLEGGQSKGIFVNIFGGINRCDQVAKGILEAAKNTPIEYVIMATTMEGGAETIVKLVKEAQV